ncbi:MAG TPA: 3-hydroxyacyl-CoA dehydrogenase family protein [Thermomicrobiales bacterium]|nr:3-hydroxyacyl-CoA dehydrogenase family protein [Thermomicrobiales bacterium]
MPIPSLDDATTRPVAVIGAGTLGRRIAAMLTGHGADVRLYDIFAAQLREAAAYVNDTAPGLAEQSGKLGNLTTTTDMQAAVSTAWLVVEAVPERLELKREVFAQLDELAPPDAILATNSSSLKSSLLIDEVSKPERVLNAHFYQPPRWNAVELMSCGQTDPTAIELLMAMLARHGLEPFHVRKESTGFIYNRVWAAIKREALLVVADGVAEPEDIDRIFCSLHGAEMGPFRLMDLVGLDVVLDIEEIYAAERDGTPEGPRRVLRGMIASGKLGVKSGEGFYRY